MRPQDFVRPGSREVACSFVFVAHGPEVGASFSCDCYAVMAMLVAGLWLRRLLSGDYMSLFPDFGLLRGL
jgi:hypothetical protein